MDPSAEFARAPHVFEIRIPNMIYYVGEDQGSVVVSTESGKGLEQAQHWEHAIRQALMPVTPTTSINQGTQPRCMHEQFSIQLYPAYTFRVTIVKICTSQ